MTIPFLDLFKRAAARFGKKEPAPQVVAPRAPIIEKPAGERLSKTVMPNATRTVAPADPFQVAAGSAMGRSRETPTPLTPALEPRDRSISLAVADFIDNLPQTALKPRDSFDPNRTVSLKCIEVEKGMATGQPTVLLSSIYESAPDIFKQGVETGDQTQVVLPFQKVLEQIQALQVREDQTEDEAVPQVETPFLQVTIDDSKKFGTSLSPLQTSAIPPVKVEPATARSIAKAEPEPVAQEKHPSNVSGRKPISLTPKLDPDPATKTAPASPAPPTSPESPSAPARIPFKLPPNGAGAPASERVPASSGPPVPTPPSAPPAPPKPATPSRIPFKMTPPGPELKPKLTLVPGVDPVKSEPPAASGPPPAPPKPKPAKPSLTSIKLRLNVCFRNLPIFQLKGELPQIADDVLIELPYSVIEPQLASGRVAVESKLFQQAIPENYRDLFAVDAAETPVLLPLQEVLQHLPSEALQMRDDQEHEEAVDHFETPFSRHAQEDQTRFGKAPLGDNAETSKPAESGAPAPADVPKVEQPEVEKITQPAASFEIGKAFSQPDSAAAGEASPVPTAESGQTAAPEPQTPATGETAEVKGSADVPAATDEVKTEIEQPESSTPVAPTLEAKSSAKEFVLKASCLPGVAACSISFTDGLTMAGNFPPGAGADGLCAMAPSVLQKIEKHMLETNLGALTAMTLHCS
ncbi:MAG TPA: hypothetical protein VJ719_11445, partial [Chthoniobacterales bacterium]|nr:hypothetical protein [Chthoniobacterales bacterium]